MALWLPSPAQKRQRLAECRPVAQDAEAQAASLPAGEPAQQPESPGEGGLAGWPNENDSAASVEHSLTEKNGAEDLANFARVSTFRPPDSLPQHE